MNAFVKPFLPSPAVTVDEVILQARRHAREMEQLYRDSDRSTARLLRYALDHINSGRTADAVRLLQSTIDTLEK